MLHPLAKFLLIASVMFCLGLMLTVGFASSAFAAETSPAAPVTVNELTPQMVSAIIGALVPLLVSLLVRVNANDKVKVILNLALTAITGAIAALVVIDPATGQATFGWVPFLTAWLFAFVSSVVSYLGALKHLDVNQLLLAIGGIFGSKQIEGAGVAGAQVGGQPAQDPDATDLDLDPTPEVVDPAELDDPVDGIDE